MLKDLLEMSDVEVVTFFNVILSRNEAALSQNDWKTLPKTLKQYRSFSDLEADSFKLWARSLAIAIRDVVEHRLTESQKQKAGEPIEGYPFARKLIVYHTFCSRMYRDCHTSGIGDSFEIPSAVALKEYLVELCDVLSEEEIKEIFKTLPSLIGEEWLAQNKERVAADKKELKNE